VVHLLRGGDPLSWRAGAPARRPLPPCHDPKDARGPHGAVRGAGPAGLLGAGARLLLGSPRPSPLIRGLERGPQLVRELTRAPGRGVDAHVDRGALRVELPVRFATDLWPLWILPWARGQPESSSPSRNAVSLVAAQPACSIPAAEQGWEAPGNRSGARRSPGEWSRGVEQRALRR
jgi:hypothetical protein